MQENRNKHEIFTPKFTRLLRIRTRKGFRDLRWKKEELVYFRNDYKDSFNLLLENLLLNSHQHIIFKKETGGN